MLNRQTIGGHPTLISITDGQVQFSDADTPFQVSHEFIKSLAPANSFVYWQSAEVIDFGYFNGERIILNGYETNFSLLQEMRIFNETMELHIWKYLGMFRYRIRQETGVEENENGDCLLHKVKLWGTRAIQSREFTVLTEDRGMRLSLPIAFQDTYKNNINVFLEERRYLGEDEAGCIYFQDRRFSGLYVAVDNEMKKMEVNPYVRNN